jgi:Thioredoxin like C-terminal domain
LTSISDREIQEIEAANASYQQMYQLIRQPGPIGDRRFEIEFLGAGVEAFVFTFG